MADSYLGEIRMVGFNFAPRFWSLCSGGVVAISQNSALFALLGTYYGGDGRVTMGLPNLIGRAPLHWGGSVGPGQPFYQLGQIGGVEHVTLQAHNLPQHTHSIYATIGAPADTVDTPGPTTNLAAPRDGSFAFTNTPPGSGQSLMAVEVLKSAGSSLSTNNQQPYLVNNFIISMDGVFPSRN